MSTTKVESSDLEGLAPLVAAYIDRFGALPAEKRLPSLFRAPSEELLAYCADLQKKLNSVPEATYNQRSTSSNYHR